MQIQRVGKELLHRETMTPTSDDTLPLPEICAVALRERAEAQKEAGEAWQPTDLVFTTRFGTPIEPRNFNRYWDRRCDSAGVRRITIRDARRTCASLLDDLDVHPPVGHADPPARLTVIAAHVVQPVVQVAIHISPGRKVEGQPLMRRSHHLRRSEILLGWLAFYPVGQGAPESLHITGQFPRVAHRTAPELQADLVGIFSGEELAGEPGDLVQMGKFRHIPGSSHCTSRSAAAVLRCCTAAGRDQASPGVPVLACCFSGPPGTRTLNLWIKSPQLCH
jgi:hypothetical protein